MTKRASIEMLVFSIAIFIISLISLFSAIISDMSTSATAANAVTDESIVSTYADENEYKEKIFGLYEGNVAVYEVGSEQPTKILSTDIESLPEETVEKLREGIHAVTPEQYQSYLEDFS